MGVVCVGASRYERAWVFACVGCCMQLCKMHERGSRRHTPHTLHSHPPHPLPTHSTPPFLHRRASSTLTHTHTTPFPNSRPSSLTQECVIDTSALPELAVNPAHDPALASIRDMMGEAQAAVDALYQEAKARVWDSRGEWVCDGGVFFFFFVFFVPVLLCWDGGEWVGL